MSYNPKVVSFDRSAAYVHHRAMKNMRDNHPVDALELMRTAVEHSPENREYKLDLAEMYCEMGCHEQSNRILLDMIAQKNPPAECYFGLALNQFGRNELESARQALALYRRYARDDAYAEDAGGLSAEMDYYDAMRRPADRRQARAVQAADRACDAMKQDDPEKACRLFRRSFELWPEQPEMRALYAMALRMKGDEKAALAEAKRSISGPEPAVRALCVTAQLFWMSGLHAEARECALRAVEQRPVGVELRLLAFALGEIEMHAEAADAVKRALQETPHEKTLLHMRAVALHRSGASDSLCSSFWLRILRIDPEDSIARYYHDAAARGELADAKPGYIYEVSGGEFRRRLEMIAQTLGEGLESALARWNSDADFRRLLCWAVNTGDENCGRAAIMVIGSADDEYARSTMREFMFRGDIPVDVKLHGMLFLQLRGADTEKFMPPGMNMQDGVLPDPETLLRNMPACERQLVRFTGEIIEDRYGFRANAALAVMWQCYRQGCAEDNDALVSTQEAAAALAWNYLLCHGVKVSIPELAQLFECSRRRMVYYARRMAAVLEQHEGAQDHEDH